MALWSSGSVGSASRPTCPAGAGMIDGLRVREPLGVGAAVVTSGGELEAKLETLTRLSLRWHEPVVIARPIEAPSPPALVARRAGVVGRRRRLRGGGKPERPRGQGEQPRQAGGKEPEALRGAAAHGFRRSQMTEPGYRAAVTIQPLLVAWRAAEARKTS